MGTSSELSQSDDNLEWGIGANGTETDLQSLGETLRFPMVGKKKIPMLIRALVEVAHKWDAFPQRTRADRKQMILGYLDKRNLLSDETKYPIWLKECLQINYHDARIVVRKYVSQFEHLGLKLEDIKWLDL